MLFRLDEVQTALFEKSRFNDIEFKDVSGVDWEDFYELFMCSYNSSGTINFPEIVINGTVYPPYTFEYSRTATKVMDDYCEGKCQYHYDITVVDLSTKDTYEITTYRYNDDVTDIDIEYKPKKDKIANTCCEYPNLISIVAKCSDRVKVTENGNTVDGYIPAHIRVGHDDYIDFTYCSHCGKIHFKK